MKTIFTLTSGRSGTSYLAHFFKTNVNNCFSTHEPYLLPGNPALFGEAVAWNTYQEDERLLPLVQKKHDFIHRQKTSAYFEANHAFLKSCHRHATVLVDEPGFIHLVRNPLYVAKSELIREQLIRRLRLPFAYYRRDKERFFRWALTGHETIFKSFVELRLSRYQFYLLQWIEIEYRAMQLLDDNNWHNKVFFIEVERDLKNKRVLRNMLDFFGLKSIKPALNMNLKTNKTPFVGQTLISDQDIIEWQQIILRLPSDYKSFLMLLPYQNCRWSTSLL